MGGSWANRKSKNWLFWSVLFYTTTTNHFLIRLWCVVKSGFYMTTGDDLLSGWTKKELQSTSQSQTSTRKRSWSLFGGLRPVWSIMTFWILMKQLYISKSMRCAENCNAWSWHWSTEWAQFFSAKTPDHTLHNQCFKSWRNWATKFCLICYIHLISHWPTTTSLSLSTTFYRENTSTTSRRQKMLFKSLSSPEVQISTPQE